MVRAIAVASGVLASISPGDQEKVVCMCDFTPGLPFSQSVSNGLRQDGNNVMTDTACTGVEASNSQVLKGGF